MKAVYLKCRISLISGQSMLGRQHCMTIII
jgi:hypothetical protein